VIDAAQSIAEGDADNPWTVAPPASALLTNTTRSENRSAPWLSRWIVESALPVRSASAA
jgi:hypothetical protein